MDIPDHVFRSLAKIQAANLPLLIDQWEVIQPLVWQLHYWFDEFCGQPPYDTAYTLFYHREKRHHTEGIQEAVEIFTARYGRKFEKLIRQLAMDHVYDDFGEIPSRAECSRHYLREYRGW